MSWTDDILDELAAADAWSYSTGSEPATAPTAWAALALRAYGRDEAADRATQWLVDHQANDGTLGINLSQPDPHWPTSLAVLAWSSAKKDDQTPSKNIARALEWLDSVEGVPSPLSGDLGHDSTLIGWPWVESTHSWIEPTAFSVIALKAAGKADHPRTREAVRLLIDRQLPEGGANYGNTYVRGQPLRPHLDPTGVVLMALAGEYDPSGRMEKTLAFAAESIGPQTTAMSLAMGVMGLAAHGREVKQSDKLLEAAAMTTRRLMGYQMRQTLLTLAALGEKCPLVTLPRKGTARQGAPS